MSPLAGKQLRVLAGVLPAVAVCLAAAHFTLGAWPAAPVATPDRLALAARWLLLPGLCLLAGIGMTANRRFLSEAAIDGQRQVDDRAFEINLRYNLNTLEQTVMAAIAWLGLSLTLKPENLALIPAMAILFAVGRAAFWAGYLYAPWARAFGLGLTAYPTFFALVWLAVRTLT